MQEKYQKKNKSFDKLNEILYNMLYVKLAYVITFCQSVEISMIMEE